MSTSIALVTCAEVSSERRMWSAMPLRIALIGSTCWPPAAGRGAAGGRSCGSVGGGRGLLGGLRRAAGAPRSMNARMSFLVTRPPWPVPGTEPTSTPCSAAIRATTGETNVLPLSLTRAGSGGGGDRRGRLGARRGAASRGLGGRRLRGRLGVCPGSGSGAGWPAARRAVGRDLGELRPDVDRLAFLDEDLLDDAAARARHLGVDLVGRDLEQRLVGLDGLALVPEPFAIVPSETETPIWGMTTSIAVAVAISTPPAP